jgi:hypothetical protein
MPYLNQNRKSGVALDHAIKAAKPHAKETVKILVVKDGVKLPSNLQGLLELRYKGATLDVDDTVKLLDAIADMKGRSLP